MLDYSPLVWHSRSVSFNGSYICGEGFEYAVKPKHLGLRLHWGFKENDDYADSAMPSWIWSVLC